jgi:hypothetical protein
MPEPKPFSWKARLAVGSGWAEVHVTETTDREMVLAEVVVARKARRPMAFVASWPRSEKQGHADVYAIARAELGIG